MKQCKRGIIPRVTESYDFDRMLAELADYDMVICPYENEEGLTIKDYLRGAAAAGKSGRDVPPDGPAAGQEGEKSAQASSCPAPQARRIGLIIGPEGGFSDGEVARLKAAGAATVTLGKTILRTETAGLAALAMIMYELEL